MSSIEELYVFMQLSMGLLFTSFISILILRLDLNGSGDSESDAVFDFLLHCWRIENDFDIFGVRSLCFSISMDPK